jgi:hypothetical protein
MEAGLNGLLGILAIELVVVEHNIESDNVNYSPVMVRVCSVEIVIFKLAKMA